MIISQKTIEQAQLIAQESINKKCESSFLLWKDTILAASIKNDIPEGLQEKLTIFINENKHLFYRLPSWR